MKPTSKTLLGGVVSYNVDDGDEVKKGGSVASVFLRKKTQLPAQKPHLSKTV